MSLNWLEDIMQGVNDLESPLSYYHWSALAAISAVAKRNIWLDQFKFLLYPNIYVFLVGPSGIRKGPPVNFAKRLVTETGNTSVIAGRSSIQAIVKDMATARTTEKGQFIDDSCRFICSGEFASSLVEDPQALTILTDLYDAHYHPSWKNILVGRDSETLEEPCLTLLGASNEVHLKEVISKVDIEGGFIARSFIIFERRKNRKNALVRKPTSSFDETACISYLKEVAKLKGPFNYQNGSDDVYEEWYHQYDDEKEDATGTRSRIHTSVLKVAMLLSLTRRLDLSIQPNDIQDSLDVCSNLIGSVNKVFLPGKGSETDFGKKVSLFLQDLVNTPERTMSRQTIISKHWGYIDAFEIDKIVETLIQAGIIRVRKDGNAAKFTDYIMTDAGYNTVLELEERLRRGELKE